MLRFTITHENDQEMLEENHVLRVGGAEILASRSTANHLSAC